jgi:hypothetical protein
MQINEHILMCSINSIPVPVNCGKKHVEKSIVEKALWKKAWKKALWKKACGKRHVGNKGKERRDEPD